MTGRVAYLDAVKGFAIALVVAGHAITSCFVDWRVVQADPSPSFLFQIISSFHMPLFLFVSGLLFGQGRNRPYCVLLKSKFLTIMVPWVLANVLIRIWGSGLGGVLIDPTVDDGYTRYWYLQFLFVAIAMVGAVFAVTNRVVNRKVRFALEVLILGLAWWGLVRFGEVSFNRLRELTPWFGWLEYWQLRFRFVYFAIGVMVGRYGLIERVTSRCLLTAFVAAFFLTQTLPGLLGPFHEYVAALSGIGLTFVVFRDFAPRYEKVFMVFCQLGVFSMGIYLLHYLFLPNVYWLGEWSVKITSTLGRAATVPIQLAYVGLVVPIIVGLCIVLKKLLAQCPWVARLLFGGR